MKPIKTKSNYEKEKMKEKKKDDEDVLVVVIMSVGKDTQGERKD